MDNKVKDFLKGALDHGNGLLQLAPAWVSRAFCIPGRRLKLHPDDLSRAYRLELGTGWLLPPGILHAPGSLCTLEPQWASDVYMMFESLPSGKPIRKELMSKDAPKDKKYDLDYLVGTLDWEKNTAPDFKKRFFLPPIEIKNETPQKFQEKWVVYGKVDDKEVFSVKELTVYPDKKATIIDKGAYGLILLQGRGTINDIDIETPTLIRFGDLTRDEFFVPYPTAIRGVTIKNNGYEDLVILKFFGPDCNPGMPDP